MSGSRRDRGAERRRLLRAIEVDGDESSDGDRLALGPTASTRDDDSVARADESEPAPTAGLTGQSGPADSTGTSARSEGRSRRTALAVRPFLDEPAEDDDA